MPKGKSEQDLIQSEYKRRARVAAATGQTGRSKEIASQGGVSIDNMRAIKARRRKAAAGVKRERRKAKAYGAVASVAKFVDKKLGREKLRKKLRGK